VATGSASGPARGLALHPTNRAVPARLDGENPMPAQVPSPDQLARIAAYCTDLLDTYERYAPLIEGVEPWKADIPSLALGDALARLERCFNPPRD
jgi:hypothetical protein